MLGRIGPSGLSLLISGLDQWISKALWLCHLGLYFGAISYSKRMSGNGIELKLILFGTWKNFIIALFDDQWNLELATQIKLAAIIRSHYLKTLLLECHWVKCVIWYKWINSLFCSFGLEDEISIEYRLPSSILSKKGKKKGKSHWQKPLGFKQLANILKF